MDIQQLRDDAAEGKLSIDKLIDVIAVQQQRINGGGSKGSGLFDCQSRMVE